MMTIFRNPTQDGMKFHCLCQRFHPMISWKVCKKLRIRESAQIKNVLWFYDMEIHHKISVPNYPKLKTMVRQSIDQKLRLRNFDAKHGRIESGSVVRRWRKTYLSPVERKRSVFARRPMQSDTNPKIVHGNQNTLPSRLLSQPYHEVRKPECGRHTVHKSWCVVRVKNLCDGKHLWIDTLEEER